MTRGDIKNRIKNQIGDTSGVNDSLIESYIDWGQQDMASRRDWEWLKETDATITTASGTEEYTLATDCHKVSGQMKDITNERWIPEFNKREFDMAYPSPSTTDDIGQPIYWYLTELDSSGNQKIKLYPIPNGTYTIRYDYIKRVSNIPSDSDNPIVPNKFRPYLIDFGLARFYEKKREFGAAAYFQTKYENNVEKMMENMVASSDNEAVMRPGDKKYSSYSFTDKYFLNL